ncbi:MAG: hypothetical protein RLZZ210_1127 [Pseudomonadota bacterium]|jgi:prevent-host-death family protein
MEIVNIHNAKTHFSKLIDAVLRGEMVTIAKSGKPAALLVPIQSLKSKRSFGVLKNRIKLHNDFNEPLPQEIIDSFEGK